MPTTRLKEAFRLMRKRGLLARMNFSCCGSCGGYELTTMAVKAIESGKKKQEDIKGCCFYHRQDNEVFDRFAVRRKTATFPEYALMLRYGSMDSKEFGDIGLPCEEVGRIVCECLADAGVEYSWPNENPNVCIQVNPMSALLPPEMKEAANG